MKRAEAVLDGFVEAIFRLMLDHHLRQVVVMDLTLTQAQALGLLRSSGLPTSGLATALGITAPAVTQLTDRLVRKELIERRSTEGDRRWVNIELTEKGRLVIDGFRRRRYEVFGEALSHLDETDQDQAIELLNKLTAVFEAREQAQPEPARHLRRAPAERQTAIEQDQASKRGDQLKVNEQPAARPAKRMKIEWD